MQFISIEKFYAIHIYHKRKFIMKFKHASALWVFAISAAFSGGVYAQSNGQITITGIVDNNSCTPSLNGGNASGTVILPTLSENITVGTSTVRGITKFTIDLSGCAQSSFPARAYFYSNNVDGAMSPTFGVLKKVSGTGAGFGYVLLPDGNSTNFADRFLVSPNPTVTSQPTDSGAMLSSGSATLTYRVGYAYVNDGQNTLPNPGTLNSQANYVIYFQ